MITYMKICLDKHYLVAALLMVLIVFVILMYFINIDVGAENNKEQMVNAPVVQPITVPIVQPMSQPVTLPEMEDVIMEYDYRNLSDPLKNPVRRVARHEIQPALMRRLIDIPTLGYPDNYTQMGTLVKLGNPDRNVENRLLRLFGRQEYPGSRRYEYYTAVNSGLDQIKVPLYTRGKQELYDGDKVHVKEIDEDYRVELFRYDEPKYYPDIL